MHLLQVFIIYMGINLCRRDRCMAEERLNCSYVCAFSNQRGGETMSQGMWCHPLTNPG